MQKLGIQINASIIFLILSTVIVKITSAKDWRKVVVQEGGVTPRFIKVFEESSVKLYCGSLSSVTWMYKSNKNDRYINLNTRRDYAWVTFEFEKNNNSIKLKHLTNSVSGTFLCEGTCNSIARGTRCGINNFIDYAIIIVLNFIPPTHVVPNILEVSVGDDALLKCGSDKEVEWFGINIKDQDKCLLNNTILLQNLRKEHSGPYTCRGVSEKKVFHSTSLVIVEGYVHRLGSIV